MNEATLRSNTVNSLVWKLFERGGNAIVQLIVQIIMARLLAPEEFGALAIMLVFVNLGSMFVISGFNTALVQSPEVDEGDCSTVFWISLAIASILYIIIFLFAPFVASFYGLNSLTWPLRVLTLVLVIGAYNTVQVAIVQRRLQFRKVFNATIVSVVLSGGIGVAAAVLNAGLWALVIQ